MAFLGFLLLAAAVGLAFGARSSSKRLALLERTETVTVEHLETLAASMREGVGAGSLSFLTEVRGVVRCAEPLRSPLAGLDCVHHSSSVSRTYEETVWKEDAQGRRHSSTESGNEIVSSSQRSVPFELEDATGRIRVDPAGASFTSDKVLDKFDPNASDGAAITVGGLRIDLPALGPGRRTLGFRFGEEAIPIGRQVYVLGEATDAEGTLRIVKPRSGEPLLVSVQSEAELQQASRSGGRFFRIASIVAAVGGLVCLLVAVL